MRVWLNGVLALVLAISVRSAHASAASQSSLRFKVVDRSGRPVDFASVWIPQLRLGAYSDTEGRGHLDSIPAGPRVVVCQAFARSRLADTLQFEAGESLQHEFVVGEIPDGLKDAVLYVAGRDGKRVTTARRAMRVAQHIGVVVLDPAQPRLVTQSAGLKPGTAVWVVQQSKAPVEPMKLVVRTKPAPATLDEKIVLARDSGPLFVYGLDATEGKALEGGLGLGLVGRANPRWVDRVHWEADVDRAGVPERIEICSGIEGLNLNVYDEQSRVMLWGAYYGYGFEVGAISEELSKIRAR